MHLYLPVLLALLVCMVIPHGRTQDVHLVWKEREAIDLGLSMYQKSLKQPSQNEWLCATFIKGTETELDIILRNAQALPCDWAVIFYSHSPEAQPIQTQICDSLKKISRVRHCEKTPFTVEYYRKLVEEYISEPPAKYLNHSDDTNYIKKISKFILKDKNTYFFIPKQIMYPELLPYLKDYKSVLMMDSDILFANKDFNFSKAQSIWYNGYKNPLLVAQPVMKGSIEFATFHQDRWSSQPHIAIGIDFIEQQAHFVNSLVLEWVIRAVILATSIDYHIVYLNDWGYDSILCMAAKAFSSLVLGVPIKNRKENPVCAILTRQVVVHANTKTIKKSGFFHKSGWYVHYFYQHTYPHWFFDAAKRLMPETQDVVHWDTALMPPK